MIFKKILPTTPAQRNLIQLKKSNNLEKTPLLKSKIFRKKNVLVEIIKGKLQFIIKETDINNFIEKLTF